MILIFIHGAPAVGKLTVAKELSRLTNIAVFHNHLTVDLVTSLFPFGSEPFIRLRERIWLDVFQEAAASNTSLIFTFNPERTVNDDFIDRMMETVNSRGGTVFFVELSCAEDELERRMSSESRKQFGKLASVDQYRALRKDGAFEFPKIPGQLSIDTTARSPADSAQIIFDKVRAML